MYIFAVDTMKDSRDSHNLTQAYIDRHIDALMWLRPTHITVDSFMDWPEQFYMWVNSIRRYPEVCIIYRLNWWNWQFYNDAAEGDKVNALLYETKTAQFITDNIAYFKDGDIFDACAEYEGGEYWYTYPEPRYQQPAMKAEYNSRLQSMFTTFGAIFEAVGLDVVANHCSHTSGSFTSGLINAATAAAHNWITLDSYPDYNTDNPVTAAASWVTLLNQMATKFPGREIFITEMGYKISAVSEVTQSLVVEANLRAIAALNLPIIGICYWVGCGYEQHTDIIEDVPRVGRWVPRQAAKKVASFFANKGAIGRAPLGG